MKKIKIILFVIVSIFLVNKIYLDAKEWLELKNLYESEDILSYSKYALTNGTDADWISLGANKIETNYESGEKLIILNGYNVEYQAYDEREDILGTVMEKKTGREPLLIRLQIGSDLYLGTVDFRTNGFSFFSKYNSYSKVTLDNEIPIYKETDLVSIEDMKNYCNNLLNYIEEFQEISKKEFLSLYQSRKGELQRSVIICLAILFFCMIIVFTPLYHFLKKRYRTGHSGV